MIKSIVNKLSELKVLANLKKINNIILHKPKTSLVLFAAISFFSYAPFNIWPLMFLSFIGFNYVLFKLPKSTNKLSFKYFFIFTFIFNLVNLYWVGNSFLYHSPDPFLVYLMPIIVVAMVFGITLFYVPAFYILNKAKNSVFKQIFFIPTVFLIVEFFRTLSVFGFPWNLIGYSIASNNYLLQASELSTILICSTLILLIASLVATFNKKLIILAVLLFIIWFMGGFLRYEHLQKNKTDHLTTSTQTIQLDTIKHHNFNKNTMHNQVLRYVKEIQKYKYNKDINLIVLPEMALPYPINKDDSLLKLLQRSIGINQTLILGSPAYDASDVYNTMYILDRKRYKRYDKIMLVPFGEFMPFRNLLPFMKNFTNNFKDFGQGVIANTVSFDNKNYVGLICYEAIFPFFVKQNIDTKENTTIVNITNDAWFYGTVAPAQHALIAKARSVENNMPMIRVSNSGLSFILN